MKGRYKLLERSTTLRQYVRATIRVDVWNGTTLKPAERRQVVRDLVSWVLFELEPPKPLNQKRSRVTA